MAFQSPGTAKTPDIGSEEHKTSIMQNQYEFVCTTCTRNGKNVDASNLCKACRDFLCFKCLLWHFKYRADHVDDMVGLDEMRKLGPQGPTVMPTEKCLNHDGTPLNMFCQKDGVAGCQRCMTQDHRLCENVIPRSSLQIEAAIKPMKTTYLFGETADDTNTPRNRKGQVFPKVESYDNVSGKRRVKHGGQVGGKMDETSDGQVGGKSNKIPVGNDDDQVDGRKVRLSNYMTELQVSGKIQNVGHNPNQTSPFTDDGQVPGSSNKHAGLYSVEIRRDMNVKLQSDKETSYIWDMCLLSYGRILMSDLRNDKLKLLDSNLNMTPHCDVQYGPMGVCMINDTEAAVVVGNSDIQLVSVADKIEIGRRVELDHRCCGLFYSDGELYVSDGVTNIHVYTVEGQKLRTLRSGLNDNPEYNFEWGAVNNDGSRIYLNHWVYGIVCLDRLSGEVIWNVKDTDNNSSGVCVDGNNNVFVCRWKNGDVVQYSPDGQMAGVVTNKSEGFQCPRCICIDDARGKLIMGMDENDVVKVFDLK